MAVKKELSYDICHKKVSRVCLLFLRLGGTIECTALDAVPVRVQRFRLRLMRFQYSISHVPGRELNTVDTLYRPLVSEVDGRDDDFHKQVNAFVNFVVPNLPATEEWLQAIRDQQDEDSVCHQLKVCCQQGRLDWESLRGPLKPYFPIKTELSVVKVCCSEEIKL